MMPETKAMRKQCLDVAGQGAKVLVVVVSTALLLLIHHLLMLSVECVITAGDTPRDTLAGAMRVCHLASTAKASLVFLVGVVVLTVAFLTLTAGRSLKRLHVYFRPMVILLAVGIAVVLGGAVAEMNGRPFVVGPLMEFLKRVVESFTSC